MEKRSRRRIRDLVALAAFQGLSQNEIGCARISMMARSTNAPFKGRIQKRKTNHLQIFTFGLQRTAGPYKGANMRHTGSLVRNSDKMPALAELLACSRPQEEKPVMSSLATALVVALAATGANAQDAKSGQSDAPALPARMEHGRSYLMDECQVMRPAASGHRRSSPQRRRHRHATESKPAWARTMSPRTRSLNYSSAPCPLWPLRRPS